ncbi:FAD binding domain-containing protein [Paenibacillus thailandensis]|uniref:FAD binding domain-containing protein n=1 Tax=Paenibacillus thailandensis TaxID=393250 RepID=A0ABW5R136_9BACL
MLHEREQRRSSSVIHPQTAAEAAALYNDSAGEAVFVAGGTWLRTQWEAGTARFPGQLIDLGRLPGISGIAETSEGVTIGAMTTLSACRQSGLLRSDFPLLAEAARAIAAPSVRNLATIGGNVMCGGGDALPALLVYEALLRFHDGKAPYSVRLADWLASPRKDAVLLGVELPWPEAAAGAELHSENKRLTAYHKVGRREAFTPSVVTVAIDGRLDAESGEWRDVRLAIAGGQTPPSRIAAAEDLLNNRKAGHGTLPEVYDIVMNEYEPHGDAFASVAYRKRTAANLVVAQLWQAMNGCGAEEEGAAP